MHCQICPEPFKAEHTIALADFPLGEEFQHLVACLTTQGGSSGESETDTAEVVLLTLLVVAQKLNKYGRHHVQHLDLESLDGCQKLVELELLKNNDLVSSVVCEVGYDYEAVDVAEGEHAERDLGV